MSIDRSKVETRLRRLSTFEGVLYGQKNGRLLQDGPDPVGQEVSLFFAMTGSCPTNCEEGVDSMDVLVGTIPDLEDTSFIDTVVGFNVISNGNEPSGSPSLQPSQSDTVLSSEPSSLPSSWPTQSSSLSPSTSGFPSVSDSSAWPSVSPPLDSEAPSSSPVATMLMMI